MQYRDPKLQPSGQLHIYGALLYMAVFTFFPIIIPGGTSLDAVGLGGMAMFGAYFGAYYSVHGTVWIGQYKGVLAPVLIMVAVICVYLIARGVSGEEAVPPLIAAVGKWVGGVMAAVLGANLGRRYQAGNKPRRMVLCKEFALLIAIFVASLGVAYAQCTGDGLFWNSGAILQYAALFAVAVTGASLGARYSSYKVRLGGQLWYGVVAIVLLFILSYGLLLTDIRACGDSTVLPLTVALILVTNEMLVALLGAHYSVRLKERFGAG